MNRNGGLIAAFLAVLALLGVSNLSRTPEIHSAAEPKQTTSPPGRTPADRAKPYAPCLEIASRLRRVTGQAHESTTAWGFPGSCYEDRKTPPDAKPLQALADVQFVVATLPSPVSTHLPLSFDRMVESIQQAAQDDGYSYDASWFPWDADRKDYSGLADQLQAEEQRKIHEHQPGLMVFRRADGPAPYRMALVVFVAGEQPTGGINDEQFRNAVEWIRLLGGLSSNRLRILGPTFSGSAPSLQYDLEPFESGMRIEAYSGTVSSGPSYTRLKKWMDSRNNGSSFWTAMEDDALMMESFCQYLSAQGYDGKRVAVLSEDETAFGTDRKQEGPDNQVCTDAVRLYYPRDIATLRSAYESQSILTPPRPPSTAEAPSTALRGDLSEPSTSEHDTVRRFGGQLTALAQESILIDITHRLAEKQIQFVILRSTSSLDQIFLSQFLRRAYSGARVVVDGADLLFSRGAEGRSLLGVMLLSTYPLLTWEQDWTASLRHGRTTGYRTFGDNASEGAYIAARNLFGTADASVPIHDYSTPDWALDPNPQEHAAQKLRPATWLAVIGHRQFWPVAVLNPDSSKGGQPSILQALRAPGNEIRDNGEARPLHLPTAMWMAVIACVLWSLIHAYFCWSGRFGGAPRARTYFAPLPQPQHPALIALGSLLVGLVPVLVAAASGLFSGKFEDHPRTESILIIVLLVNLAAAFVGCIRNYNLAPLHVSPEQRADSLVWREAAGPAAFWCLVAFIVLHVYVVSKLELSNAIPVYLRSVNLSSGVSPLLPQLFLLAGGYLWFWCNLRGLAHFGDDRPVLPKEAELPPVMPMFSMERAGEPLEKVARPLTKTYLIRLLIILAATIAICAVAVQGFSIRTLGELTFGRLIFFWVGLYIAVILTDGLELWRAWCQHRQLLIYLDRLPARRTLRALKGLAWGSIWKMSGDVLAERYRVISFQLESLRHLTNAAEKWIPDTPAAALQRACLLAELERCRQKSGPFFHWFLGIQEKAPTGLVELRDLQRALASAAGTVMSSALLPAWSQETASLIFDRSMPDERSQPEDTNSPGAADAPTRSEMPLHVKAAEEFFVLPYVAFIQNILGRIRTIALGSLWLFLATTLAVSSYPFDPLDVLGGMFLAVFLIFGGVSALVYAQMSRDATLSNITDTPPGALGWEFWGRLVTFGAGPLIGLLTTLFPSLTDFVFSWLQPSTQALK